MLRAKITKGTPVRSMAHDSVKLAGRTYIVTVHRITPGHGHEVDHAAVALLPRTPTVADARHGS